MTTKLIDLSKIPNGEPKAMRFAKPNADGRNEYWQVQTFYMPASVDAEVHELSAVANHRFPELGLTEGKYEIVGWKTTSVTPRIMWLVLFISTYRYMMQPGEKL